MTDAVNIRMLALDALIEINENGRFFHQVTRAVLDKYQYLDKSQRAFFSRLVEGTLEQKLGLDYAIDSISKTPVSKQKPLIRNLLRMSFYQLYEMDHIPASAVCNEAVKLAKRRGFSGLSGFVNGVLRTAARGEDPRRALRPSDDPVTYLIYTYSMPEWIVRLWLTEYGLERTESILSAFLRERPLTVRADHTKGTTAELAKRLRQEGVGRVRIAPLPDIGAADAGEAESPALAIGEFDHLSALPSFREGLFYVQDISSMSVALFSGVKENDRVIDVCAAPGGKSTHIAQLLGKTGSVEARDLTPEKVALIEENIRRCGITNMRAVVKDATVRDPKDEAQADILICDLPCSGLGVIGRKPDIRYNATPEKTGELVALQKQILGAVCGYVKKGGSLCYSTCTIHRAENEDMVAWFLSQYPQYTLEFEKQMLPDEGDWDGFYLARLRRSK